MDSDLELLRRFHRGDAAAMDRLVDRYSGVVYAYVHRFLGGKGADDLTQEVWLKVLRRSASFDGRSRFSTWLFSVTRNVCIDHLRRKQRRSGRTADPEQPFALDSVEAPETPMLERLAQRELAALVQEGVAELPPPQREVFLLREQTDLSFEEIGEVLDVPRETVKSRMRYALGRLRRFVRGRAGQEVEARGL